MVAMKVASKVPSPAVSKAFEQVAAKEPLKGFQWVVSWVFSLENNMVVPLDEKMESLLVETMDGKKAQ